MWGWIVKNEVVLYILAAIIILRLPFLFEPYWYGDEGIYLTIGESINKGAVLYRDITDYPNKPPVIYFLAAIAGGKLFWFKFFALISVLSSTVIFYMLARNWFGKDDRTVILSTLIFGFLVSWPKLEGNIVNAEILFILPNLVAIWILSATHRVRGIFLAGVCYGLASLIKFQAGLEIVIWPIVWLMLGNTQVGRKVGLLLAGWVVPVFGVWLYFLANGMGLEVVKAVVGNNFGYVNYGYLVSLGVLVCSVMALVWLAKNKIKKEGVVWGVWFAVACAASLFSGRPYPHYLLQMVPVVALGVGLVIVNKGVLKNMAVAGMVAMFLIWKFGEFYKYETLGYYRNFLRWSFGIASDREYRGWFGKKVVDTYDFSQTISANSNSLETVFVWGDNSMVYALARRRPAAKYVVDFHVINDERRNTLTRELVTNPPKYIVVDSTSKPYLEIESLLASRYIREKSEGNSMLYRRLGINQP